VGIKKRTILAMNKEMSETISRRVEELTCDFVAETSRRKPPAVS
jgi:hypothetical protein